jgi:hypothetical protein
MRLYTIIIVCGHNFQQFYCKLTCPSWCSAMNSQGMQWLFVLTSNHAPLSSCFSVWPGHIFSIFFLSNTDLAAQNFATILHVFVLEGTTLSQNYCWQCLPTFPSEFTLKELPDINTVWNAMFRTIWQCSTIMMHVLTQQRFKNGYTLVWSSLSI